MPRKPDTPCAGCGKLLWGGSTSKPAGERMCRSCRAGATPPAPVPSPVLLVESAGDRVRLLEAMRDKLARELEAAEGKDAAPISRALLDVIRELHAGKPQRAEQPEKAVGGVISLAAEAAKRRSQAAG